jgi:uncharacterized protein (TIGR03085 family)
MTSYAVLERASLADLMDGLGPDAPTLCAGWTVADLAAHLVLRERRPDAAPGILVGPLAGYAEKVQRRIRDGQDFAQLVAQVRAGPPAWSPTRIGAVNEAANLMEFVVHHEDVRRAQDGWQPRDLDQGEDDLLWRRGRGAAKLLCHRAPGGLVFARDGDGREQVRSGEPSVTVSGSPVELLLFSFGRGEHARLDFEGDPAAVDRLRQTRFGV